jgi:hypothetical protein
MLHIRHSPMRRLSSEIGHDWIRLVDRTAGSALDDSGEGPLAHLEVNLDSVQNGPSAVLT